jgi:hypothetical protein
MSSFEILAIIVFLNVAATITLWRTAARRPEKLKKKFLDRLWHSKPITPKHQPPPPLEEVLFVRKEAWLQFVSDFEDFANVVNWHQGPWRLQELPESELSKLAEDSPAYGRRYAVFHNQARLGEIEVEPDSRYSTQDPRVLVHIQLNSVRLLTHRTIRDFLVNIALHVSAADPGTVEYFRTHQKIDLALTDVLWEAQEISQFGGMGDYPGYGQIAVELSGLASFYLSVRQSWTATPEAAKWRKEAAHARFVEELKAEKRKARRDKWAARLSWMNTVAAALPDWMFKETRSKRAGLVMRLVGFALIVGFLWAVQAGWLG